MLLRRINLRFFCFLFDIAFYIRAKGNHLPYSPLLAWWTFAKWKSYAMHTRWSAHDLCNLLMLVHFPDRRHKIWHKIKEKHSQHFTWSSSYYELPRGTSSPGYRKIPRFFLCAFTSIINDSCQKLFQCRKRNSIFFFSKKQTTRLYLLIRALAVGMLPSMVFENIGCEVHAFHSMWSAVFFAVVGSTVLFQWSKI